VTRQVLGGPLQSERTLAPATRTRSPIGGEEALRKRRSPAYLAALKGLDLGGHSNTQALDALRQAIAAEFPQAEAAPLGWVSKCYLGVPYEVHTLDASGSIVIHYRWGEPLPPPLERARALARSGRYLMIEVHADRLVAISEDGATSVCAI